MFDDYPRNGTQFFVGMKASNFSAHVYVTYACLYLGEYAGGFHGGVLDFRS
jgi:hypothetical protein